MQRAGAVSPSLIDVKRLSSPKKSFTAEWRMRATWPAWPGSQPFIGATPPAVSTGRMKRVRANTPSPSRARTRSSSQGIAPATGAGAWAMSAAVIIVPAASRQKRPAPCVPACRPAASNSAASGPLNAQTWRIGRERKPWRGKQHASRDHGNFLS